jgi:hypothetical protein
MPIGSQNIRRAGEAMQIELRIDSEEIRQFVAQRYTEWGYRVLSLIDAPPGEPRGSSLSSSGMTGSGSSTACATVRRSTSDAELPCLWTGAFEAGRFANSAPTSKCEV